MGRRRGTTESRWLVAGLVLLGVMLMIPKGVWIALLWYAVLAFLTWLGLHLYRRWQSTQRSSALPPPPEDTGKTLAEILRESSRQTPPTASRASACAPVSQLAVPSRLPSTLPITPSPSNGKATTGIAPAVSEPSGPAPALDPPSVRANSSFSDWTADRDAIAAANRTRTQALRVKIAASDARHRLQAERFTAVKSVMAQAADDQVPGATPSLEPHRTPWEIHRDQVAKANRQRAKELREKFPADPLGSSRTPSEERGVATETITKSSQSAAIRPGEHPSTHLPPPRSHVPANVAPPVAEPSRPPPAQEPVPVPMTSSLSAPVALARPIRQPVPQRWVPFGETVLIRGQEIAGGGFYFGTPRSYEDSRLAGVDPTLPFSAQADWDGERLGYWPRYAGLNDRERGTFLAFLNSERQATSVGIGYVFLYFYGLEHRLLRGVPRSQIGREEAEFLLSEVQRLQHHYGVNSSFRRSSGELLTVAGLIHGIALPTPEATAGTDWGITQHLAIAQVVGARQPLPADLAFLWARALCDEARSSTWNVVLPELKSLFAQLYSKRYPAGIEIPLGRSKLEVSYRWASPDRGRETIRTDLPDITRTVAPVRPLIGILQEALGELTGLRRVRRSKNRTAVAELIAMPEALRAQEVLPDAFRPLANQVDELLANSPRALISTKDVLSACGLSHLTKVGKRDATTLAQALAALGYGMEPDVRFLAQSPTVDGAIVVFHLAVDASRSPTPAYAAAMLLVQSALAVAGSSDEISESELQIATQAIEAQFVLPSSERQRLEAHIHWLRVNPPSIVRLESRIRQLPAPKREAFAGVLVDIAGADGHISPAEVRVIERFYRALGLESSRMHADLHHASLGARGRRKNTDAPAGLDADVIAKKLEETARVQSVLAQIFAEEEPPEPHSTTPSSTATNPDCTSISRLVIGLDPGHASLLQSVLDREGSEWERSAFESICEALDLLPDGALEILNEASFTIVGEALLEGEDPLYLNDFARAELQTALVENNTEPV